MARRMVDAPALLGPAQFPVAVVVAHHRAGAQPPLQRLAPLAGDALGRLLQGDLDLGQRRHRHFRRHKVVEDAVAPHVGVRQHIVADGLRLPQAAAMADHQPAMRAQHGEMVGRRLGVGGADADIDDGDAAAAVAAQQVVGRHLEAMPGRGEHGGFGHRRCRRRAARRRRPAARAGCRGRRAWPAPPSPRSGNGRHSAGSWWPGSRAGWCASRCPCSGSGGAASSRPGARRTGRAAARARSCDTQVPSAISSPTLASTGVGKWRASSDTERSPWMNSSPASVTKG